jgi:hypothetical protein
MTIKSSRKQDLHKIAETAMTAMKYSISSDRSLDPVDNAETYRSLRPSRSIAFSRRKRRILSCTLLLLVQYPSYSNGWSPSKISSRASSISISQKIGGTGSRIKKVMQKITPVSLSSSNEDADADVSLLQSENYVLRDTIRQLEEENQKLKQSAKIVLENFEGGRLFRGDVESSMILEATGITLTGDEIAQDQLWCDELDGGKPFA